MKGLALFAFDIRFQWRHGFYFVYLLVCAVYWVLFWFVPEPYRDETAIVLAFSDPCALGLIMAGGIVLLERDQGVHDPLFVCPIDLRSYLLAKAGSLSLLSLIAGWIIHMTSGSIPGSPLTFSAGILLTSSLMTLLSIGVAVRYRSINSFILMIQVYALPFVLPLLGFFDLWDTDLFLLLPTEGTLRLLESLSGGVNLLEVLYSIFILLIWNYGAYLWAYRSYTRYVRMNVGEERGTNDKI
ncbi:ABC transporter permease [Paenibacillus lutrae]|uniref:ABC transporter permease n=1 Tax=Paenibacillus lutrae TaxID=2078573 RepID=A0A7X3FF68_9BACL|nr:ABC transporter permease [Paenibacillus lutrae]MVO98594.1 ABC transporter permease [Paenibacillus lutrae]